MPKKSIALTSEEVKKLLGISDRTLKKWKKEYPSFPVVRVGRVNHYDPVKLLDWLMTNDREKYAVNLSNWLKEHNAPAEKSGKLKKTAGKKRPGPKPQKGKITTPGTGIGEAFDFKFRFPRGRAVDVFAVKEMAGELLKKLVGSLDGADMVSVAAITKNLNVMAEGFRKLESSCIEVDEQLGNVVPVSDVIQYHGEMITRLKTDLRALPYALADELSGLRSPEKISKLLKQRIDDALRHLAEEINADAIRNSRSKNK